MPRTRGLFLPGASLVAAVVLAGCGSAAHGGEYSVQQVTAAFASEGISLHKNTDISIRGASWLSSSTRSGHDPAVIAVVLSRPSAGQTSFQQSGRGAAEYRRLGDVRVVWSRRTLDSRVRAAFSKLGDDAAPAQPKPKPSSNHAHELSFVQTLARIPRPLGAAVRKTAAAPSAHVAIVGKEIAGSGDYSTVQQIGELRMKAFCFKNDEVIDGTTYYTRSSFPGKPMSKKWVKQSLNDVPAAALHGGWPRAQLLTFATPLAELAQADHVSNLGRQTIHGVETTHYRAHLNFFNGLPRIARRQTNAMSAIDVWVDESDGYIRRVHSGFAGADETVNLSRFGEQVHVTIPPADQTIDLQKSRGHEELTISSGSMSTCPRP